MLSFKNVTKKYGNVVAVENISFEISDGEFVFIAGPSGSGKSTIIKLILRQIVPDSGEIILDNNNIGTLKQRDTQKIRQRMGVIFQDFKMIPERNLWENVEIALAVTRVPQNEWKNRVAHVIDLVGLSKRGTFFPNQLSGGELQRGALARALVTNPSIILADEPTGNLDWTTAEGIMELFEAVNKEGKTVVMATHHLGIIEKFKKRIIELKSGKIISDSRNKRKEEKSENMLPSGENEKIAERKSDKN